MEVAATRSRRPAPLLYGIRFLAGELVASVFIWYRGDVARLELLGARLRTVVGDIATADVGLDALARLDGDPDVLFIELARPASPTLDRSVPAVEGDRLHESRPPITGAGTLIGIIDIDGIDFYHDDFCTLDGDTRRTRFVAIWDQRGPHRGPILGRWDYGVEWTEQEINTTLTSGDAHAPVSHRPECSPEEPNHGTQMAGIAGGNGRASNGKYTGVAPDARLLFVNTFGSGVEGFADMTRVADALAYVFARAEETPCVVSMSLGDSLGAHDGTSLIERLIDRLVATPGRAVVVSAGNSNDAGKYVTGPVPLDGSTELDFNVPVNTADGEALQIWYSRGCSLNVALFDPRGEQVTTLAAPIEGCCSRSVKLGSRIITLTSTVCDRRNGDNVIQLLLDPGLRGAYLPEGKWRLELRRRDKASSLGGEYHAWIDVNTKMRWVRPTRDRCTLATPATARGAITVGSYMLSVGGQVSATSGRGPTRDGRRKPDLIAPGACVTAPIGAADPLSRGELYGAGGGTSQAAALVAGLTALLFQCRGRNLDVEQIKSIFRSLADRSGLSPRWDAAYGFGRVRAAGACHVLVPVSRGTCAPASSAGSAENHPSSMTVLNGRS